MVMLYTVYTKLFGNRFNGNSFINKYLVNSLKLRTNLQVIFFKIACNLGRKLAIALKFIHNMLKYIVIVPITFGDIITFAVSL